MPSMRKLTVEEVQTIEHKGVSQRKIKEEMYDRLVAQFATDEWGELDLDEGESRLSVRQAFNKAAIRAGVTVEWKRVKGDYLRFHVISSPNEPVEESSDDEEAAPEENGEAATLAEFELEPAPAPVEKKAPARKPRVTGRQQYVEAP